MSRKEAIREAMRLQQQLTQFFMEKNSKKAVEEAIKVTMNGMFFGTNIDLEKLSNEVVINVAEKAFVANVRITELVEADFKAKEAAAIKRAEEARIAQEKANKDKEE